MVNASWIMFINVHAAYPVAFAALFARSFWRSASVIAATVMFSLLGAHPHPFCYLLIFGGLLALGFSCVQRSWRPAAAFALGSTIATIAMLPLIIPVLAGFATSWRHGRMDIEFVRSFNLPWDQLVLSWISGPADLLVHRDVELHYADPVFVAALAWSLVNLPLLLTLLWRRRRFSTTETVLLVTILICGMFIVRPLWLATALSQVPFLRSLRWPFREIAVLNACTHLLAVFCLTPKLRGPFRVGVIGSAALASVFLFYPAPTFNPLQLDRTMIISGKVAEFQRELARIYGPERRLMISSARHLLLDQEGPQPIPFAAMGAYNYASLFRVVNVAGYSSTIPHTASPEAHDLEPIHWAGIYSPEQANRILAANPDLLHLTVTSLDPLLVATARGPERHLFEFDRQSGNFHEVPVTGE
ncbi:MAG: hypothetical protein H0T11_07750 [Chthoniobacterales bacterium]|nr:hypothetical protein [Chthoniobacterales bacterium]